MLMVSVLRLKINMLIVALAMLMASCADMRSLEDNFIDSIDVSELTSETYGNSVTVRPYLWGQIYDDGPIRVDKKRYRIYVDYKEDFENFGLIEIYINERDYSSRKHRRKLNDLITSHRFLTREAYEANRFVAFTSYGGAKSIKVDRIYIMIRSYAKGGEYGDISQYAESYLIAYSIPSEVYYSGVSTEEILEDSSYRIERPAEVVGGLQPALDGRGVVRLKLNGLND